MLFYEAPMGHCSIKDGDGPHEYVAPLHCIYLLIYLLHSELWS